MISRKFTLATSAAAVVALAAASQAALLTYDVRAVGGSSGVTVNNAKSVTVSGAGNVVQFELYGVLQATNAATSGITAAGGSILSGTGGLLGSIGNGAIPSNFQGPGFTAGAQADLDGDSDLDLGSNTTNSSPNFFIDRSSAGTSPTFGISLLLGTFSFTVGGTDGSTTLNFRPALLTTGTAATRNYHNFQIDGVTTATNGSDAALVAAAAPVSIGYSAVPEPTTLAALAGLGAVALRRRRAI